RARQRDLRLPAGAAAQKRELLRGQVAPLAQRRNHRQPLWPRDRGITHLGRMPLPPQPGVDIHAGKAVAGGGELALERLAPHLPVVDHRQAHFLLPPPNLPHPRPPPDPPPARPPRPHAPPPHSPRGLPQDTPAAAAPPRPHPAHAPPQPPASHTTPAPPPERFATARGSAEVAVDLVGVPPTE